MISRQSPCFQDARERYGLPLLIASALSKVAVALRSPCGLYDEITIGTQRCGLRTRGLQGPSGTRLATHEPSSMWVRSRGSYEPRDREVVAVEPSAVMIAKRPARAASAVLAAAERLPFPDGSFDAATAIITLQQTRVSEERDSAVSGRGCCLSAVSSASRAVNRA
jgi:hypothetical protein